MTRKLFWTEPYRTDCEARVMSVEGNSITLDQTVFYALSGGQESDHGSIGGQTVLEARRQGNEIRYFLGDGHGLRAGDAVRVEIDWPRRYRLMRLHFAAELVLELTYKALPGINKIGAHIAEDKARIDFEHPDNLSSLLPLLESQVKSIVRDDLMIISGFSDQAAGRRYWELKDFARVPCGGTHLAKTGEVGAITLKRRNPGRGKERIEITLEPGVLSRRLHIGGTAAAPGWEVLNANAAPYVDHVGNANDLSRFPEGCFSDIYASHVVEHLDYSGELVATLSEWRRVLQPGGKLHVSVPDMDVLADLFLLKDRLSADERFHVMRMMFGGHVDKYDYHLVGLNEEFLSGFLAAAGYCNVSHVADLGFFDDTSRLQFRGMPISLNMTAERPG